MHTVLEIILDYFFHFRISMRSPISPLTLTTGGSLSIY